MCVFYFLNNLISISYEHIVLYLNDIFFSQNKFIIYNTMGNNTANNTKPYSKAPFALRELNEFGLGLSVILEVGLHRLKIERSKNKFHYFSRSLIWMV